MRLRALVALLALSLAACSFPGLDDDPEPPAEELARALESGRVTDVMFAGTAPAEVEKELARVTAGMGSDPTVETRSVETGDDTAAVTLTWSWDVGGEPWSYDTTADVTRSGETWRVVWTRKLVEPSLARDEVLSASTVQADRGEVTGAGGSAIVTDRPVVRFGIDKTRVRSAAAATSARTLARLLDIDPEPYLEQVEAAGDEAFVEGLVVRRDEVPAKVRASYAQIRGVAAVLDEIPLAPTREFAAPILGAVGPVTAEMVESTEGRYAAGDVAGLSGLQARYDDELTGRDGVVVHAVHPDNTERRLFEAEAVDGEALETTLDPDLQTLAEGALADVGPPSALVAIRPSSGDVLAAASGPGGEGYNTATFGQYAPGSTFKVVSSLALLRSGLEPDDVVSCPSTTTVDGKSFKNYDDYPPDGIGDIPFQTALASSCNTAFISERDRLSGEQLGEAAAALGLGLDHDLGFPAYFGQVPPAESETEGAADMIGQGKVLASPLVMAAVVASVVRGQAVLPRLLPDYQPEQTAPAIPLTGQEAGKLRELMRGVVDGGSASFLADVPGDPVLAKTGTAEYGGAQPLETHTWMIAAHGDLAVATFVETGESGSQTAGPILEKFLRGVR